MSLDENFKKAAEIVKNLKTTPNEDELLRIYSLYKQAEFGNCNTPKPGFLDFKGNAKWEAWTSLKGLSQEEAKQQYITKVEDLVKKYELK